jgi:hypothetical protein
MKNGGTKPHKAALKPSQNLDKATFGLDATGQALMLRA